MVVINHNHDYLKKVVLNISKNLIYLERMTETE